MATIREEFASNAIGNGAGQQQRLLPPRPAHHDHVGEGQGEDPHENPQSRAGLLDFQLVIAQHDRVPFGQGRLPQGLQDPTTQLRGRSLQRQTQPALHPKRQRHHEPKKDDRGQGSTTPLAIRQTATPRRRPRA